MYLIPLALVLEKNRRAHYQIDDVESMHSEINCAFWKQNYILEQKITIIWMFLTAGRALKHRSSTT